MPPAKLSPAPVGSTTWSAGKAGRTNVSRSLTHQAAVLALLDDDELRAHLQHLAGGFDEVLLLGQQPGFAVVEHQAVDLAEQLAQLGALGLIQRFIVSATISLGCLSDAEHLLLQRRVRVGEEDVFAVEEVLGNLRRPLGQHVQIDLDA